MRYLRTDVEAAKYFPVSDRPNTSCRSPARPAPCVGFGGDDVRVTDRYLARRQDVARFGLRRRRPARPADRRRARRKLPGDRRGGGGLSAGSAAGARLRGRLFSEFGTLTGVDLKGDDILDESSIRRSRLRPVLDVAARSAAAGLRLAGGEGDYDKDNTSVQLQGRDCNAKTPSGAGNSVGGGPRLGRLPPPP